jgi:nitrogen fixation-related uncharacterized protein
MSRVLDAVGILWMQTASLFTNKSRTYKGPSSLLLAVFISPSHLHSNKKASHRRTFHLAISFSLKTQTFSYKNFITMRISILDTSSSLHIHKRQAYGEQALLKGAMSAMYETHLSRPAIIGISVAILVVFIAILSWIFWACLRSKRRYDSQEGAMTQAFIDNEKRRISKSSSKNSLYPQISRTFESQNHSTASSHTEVDYFNQPLRTRVNYIPQASRTEFDYFNQPSQYNGATTMISAPPPVFTAPFRQHHHQ